MIRGEWQRMPRMLCGKTGDGSDFPSPDHCTGSGRALPARTGIPHGLPFPRRDGASDVVL